MQTPIHLDTDVKKGETIMVEQWKGTADKSTIWFSYWDKEVHADKDTVAIWRINYKHKKQKK